MWGSIQHSENVMRGWRIVSTAGHGGHMMTFKFAQKHLPESFLKTTPRHNGYYCFEEDSFYTVPLCLCPFLKDAFVSYVQGKGSTKSAIDIASGLLDDASQWHADVLRVHGVLPSEKSRIFDMHSEADALRESKSPDIVISAWGSWAILVMGHCLLEAADGNFLLVKNDDYDTARLKAKEIYTARVIPQIERIVPFSDFKPLTDRAREYAMKRLEVYNAKATTVRPMEKESSDKLKAFIRGSIRDGIHRSILLNDTVNTKISGKLNCDISTTEVDAFIDQLAHELSRECLPA